MNLQELYFILCINKHQNLTSASRELYISQPTLSKFLKRVEQELGGKLFSHTSSGYRPTYLGKRYMEYAKKMIALHEGFEKELSDIVSNQDGELNIAFPLMRSSCIIPEILPVFHDIYPGIRLNFLEESSAIQERLLLDSQIDFAIFSESHPHPQLTYETLLEEEVLLVISSEHPLAARGVHREDRKYPWMDLHLFAEEKFVLHFPEQTTGAFALELFEEYNIFPPVPYHTRNTQTAVLLSQQGLGACFVPESYLKSMSLSRTPACFCVGEKRSSTTLSIAYQKGTYLSSYARDFIRITREYLAEG